MFRVIWADHQLDNDPVILGEFDSREAAVECIEDDMENDLLWGFTVDRSEYTIEEV